MQLAQSSKIQAVHATGIVRAMRVSVVGRRSSVAPHWLIGA